MKSKVVKLVLLVERFWLLTIFLWRDLQRYHSFGVALQFAHAALTVRDCNFIWSQLAKAWNFVKNLFRLSLIYH